MNPDFVLYLHKQKFSNSSCATYIVDEEQHQKIISWEKTNQEFLLQIPHQDIDNITKDNNYDNPPLIGIISALEGDKYSIDEPYIQAVVQTGASIRLITYHQVEQQLQHLDGILLVGGIFPSPQEWAENPDECYAPLNNLPPRTQTYVTMINYALKHKLPMFGVCGGMQMMAGFNGGKLGRLKQIAPHSAIPHHGVNANTYAHVININKNTILYNLAGTTEHNINSMHSEVVASVPNDRIKISATSPDGIIEALEYQNYEGYALGVQWHPERMAIQGETFSKNLYAELTRQALKFRLHKQM